MMYQYRFGTCKKYHSGEGRGYVGNEPLLSAEFCYEYKTALNNEVLRKKKKKTSLYMEN